jgi:hypothetical protein
VPKPARKIIWRVKHEIISFIIDRINIEETKKLPFVYIIPGEIRHIDAHQNTDKDANLKLFLDYFVLSYSKKVYLVIEEQMYNSGFSYRAALLNNVPFIEKRY